MDESAQVTDPVTDPLPADGAATTIVPTLSALRAAERDGHSPEETVLAPPRAVAEADPVTQPPAPPADPLGDLARALDGSLADLRAQVCTLEAAAARLLADEAARADQIRTRDALLDRLDASKPNFHLQLLRPFVQRLGSLADSMADWEKAPPTDADGFSRCFAVLNQQVREMLALHGITEVRPAAGDTLDVRCHHVAETRPTADPAAHDRVAELLQHGYLYFGQHDRTAAVVPTLIRPARVATWKHDPAAAPAN